MSAQLQPHLARGQPVRLVLFDLDGTLVFHEPDSFDLITAFCADIGQPLNAEAERRGRRVRHEYFVDPIIRSELDGLPRTDFWRHFNHHLLSALGIGGDLDRLAREVSARFEEVEMAYRCPAAGCSTLRELRARGYRLGLITNRENVARFHSLLDEMALRPHFDLVLASGEVGVRKPDPAIFCAAIERLEASAKEAVYVGDNYWADVVGAEQAGIWPVLLDPHRLFPEARCTVIERIEQLLDLL